MTWDIEQGCCCIYNPKRLSIHMPIADWRAHGCVGIGVAGQVVLDFSRRGCAYCAKQLPVLQDLYTTLHYMLSYFSVFRCQKRTCATGKAGSQLIKRRCSLELFFAHCLGRGLVVFRDVSWPLLVAALIQ